MQEEILKRVQDDSCWFGTLYKPGGPLSCVILNLFQDP